VVVPDIRVVIVDLVHLSRDLTFDLDLFQMVEVMSNIRLRPGLNVLQVLPEFLKDFLSFLLSKHEI